MQLNSTDFWAKVEELCTTHGLVRTKMDKSVIQRPLDASGNRQRPIAYLATPPKSDADLFNGTGGGCTDLYEVTDRDGGVAFELYFSDCFQDMLVRPQLVPTGAPIWKRAADGLWRKA